MAVPPKSTIFFVDVPSSDVFKQFSIGIDFNFFNFDGEFASQFRGVKLIEPGLHFFHYNNLSLGVRFGFFIQCLVDHLYFLKWDPDTEEFSVITVNDDLQVVSVSRKNNKRKIEEVNDNVDELSLNVSKWATELPEYYQFMINYETLLQQSNFLNKDWEKLTSQLSMSLVNSIFPDQGSVTTSSPVSTLDASRQENDILAKAIRESVSAKYIKEGKGLSLIDQEPILQSLQSERYKELKFTAIDLKKTQRPDATAQEKTKDSMDKSWYLQDILTKRSSEHAFLGEFQLSFILLVVLNNFNAVEQWIAMIKTVVMSHELASTSSRLHTSFVELLNEMLDNLPKELVEDETNEGIVKLYDKELLQALKDFQNYLFYDTQKTPQIIKLQKATLKLFEKLRLKFDILISLDDNDEIDEEIDTDDEYKPVIVSI